MDGVIFGVFALSAVLFFGMFHYLMSSRKPGIYPPKHLLRKRAGGMGVVGAAFFIIGIILYMFN